MLKSFSWAFAGPPLQLAVVLLAVLLRALLGLRGLVFKSHGSADAFAFEQALVRAYDAAHNQLLDNVRARIAHAAPLMAAKGAAALSATPA